MKVRSAEFKERSAQTAKDPRRQAALKLLYDGLHKGRISAAEATSNWDELRAKGRAIKWHTINNLDYYLELLEERVVANGGKFTSPTTMLRRATM